MNNFLKQASYTILGGALSLLLIAATSMVDYNHQVKNIPVIPVGAYGVVADGVTDQSAKLNTLVSQLPSTGVIVYFTPAPLCYIVGSNPVSWTVSNVEIQIPAGACVKKQAGNHANPIFRVGSGASLTTNVWFTGGGVIDGNKALITGIAGDGFNVGIHFFGASNSGIRGLTLRNAYTDNVYVDCWYDSPPFTGPHNGDSVILDTVVLTGAGRNNYTGGCGTGNKILHSTILNGGARVPVAGVDFEIFEAGQLMSGAFLEDVEIYGDGGICVDFKPVWDAHPTLILNNVRCHDNAGIVSVDFTNFGSVTPGSLLEITGGYYHDGVAAAININNASAAYISEADIVTSGDRGILSDAHAAVITLGPGNISGATYDIDINCTVSGKFVILAGATLVHGTTNISAGCSKSPITGLTSDVSGNVVASVSFVTQTTPNWLGNYEGGNFQLSANPIVVNGRTLAVAEGYCVSGRSPYQLRTTPANTFNQTGTPLNIVRASDPSNSTLSKPYAAGANITLCYDPTGPVWTLQGE